MPHGVQLFCDHLGLLDTIFFEWEVDHLFSFLAKNVYKTANVLGSTRKNALEPRTSFTRRQSPGAIRKL